MEKPEPQPVTLTSRHLQSSHTVVQLPQGWTPVKLPDPVHADSTFGTVDATVTFAEGKLTVDRRLVLRRDKVEVSELAAFQTWEELVDRSLVPVALRSTLYYPDRDASAGNEQQKKAALLVDEAHEDIQLHELEKADAALKQAEGIDPGHEILHENRGELAAARGDNVTALAEYRKELEAYPEALIEMESIANAQRKLGDVDGAIATLQRWMVADPNSCFAAIDLMQQYHSMGLDDKAVRVGDDAMILMTKDAKRSVNFLLTYGHEQILTGRTADAKVTLEALLDLTVDDGIVNDAAYFLSEQGVALDRAERAVREALTQFDTNDPATALSTSYANGSQSDLLLATWDTLGWILYRRGAVHEAEGYVRAAWRSRQDIAISRHLGEILESEEKPGEALDVYTLGLAANEGDAKMAKDPHAQAVRDAIILLNQKGIVTTLTDPQAALLASRTLDLGPVAKSRASTPCVVSLTPSQMVITALHDQRAGEPIMISAEDPIVVLDKDLIAKFFPPGSNTNLILKGSIQCIKSCSLAFTH